MGPKEAGIDYYLTPLIHHIEVDNGQILRSEFVSFIQDNIKSISIRKEHTNDKFK